METSYANKPYFFAPLMGKVDRYKALNRQNLLASDTQIGKLRVNAQCLTPLHFGSGQLVFNETTRRFSHSLLRQDNRIALPGSSFKGMLRSVFEAVTESCVLNAPRTLPLKLGSLNTCGSNSDSVCPACSVFGRLSYRGKLTISAFYTDDQPINMHISTLEQPFRTYPRPSKGDRDPRTGNERLYYGDFRDTHGLDIARLTKAEFFAKKEREPRSGGNFYGRKFYKHSNNWEALTKSPGKDIYECLPIGAVLSGYINYQGLSDEELGALLFSLGLGWGGPIFHKLGYAKPAYLGSVKLSVSPEYIPRYEETPMTGVDLEGFATRYYEDHKSSIKPAIDALNQAWSEIGDSIWMKQDGKYGY